MLRIKRLCSIHPVFKDTTLFAVDPLDIFGVPTAEGVNFNPAFRAAITALEVIIKFN